MDVVLSTLLFLNILFFSFSMFVWRKILDRLFDLDVKENELKAYTQLYKITKRRGY